ncbi:acyl-CoA dehydrogenase family protein [Actinokineospora sp. NBRC 105648]|uniref:acyl-CoA dehydrogenase family protein n=1 Tax=Actinokineospora sp. NBRC 105648 TaxID=3032206 RepID=UPI0024A2318F|nr:acyl-CoA dehydrogenase family protein [Actinokineospora sp. NBRC 105648]GLZ36630.1 hydrolase [Actinokineospora sp. NBRC 105648]
MTIVEPAVAPTPRATGVGIVAARLADRTESARTLPDDVVAALRGAGFARHLVPARWGGAGGTYIALLRAVAEVGESCASTAWNAAVHAIVGRMAAHLPAAGCAEIWDDGPNELLAGSIAPTGQVSRSTSGYRLTGTWPFASGVDHSAWTLLGALTPEREYRFFMVPRAHYRVLKTWDNVGLAGTGSNAVELEDVYVPEHLTAAHSDLMAGKVDVGRPLVPFKAVNGLTFVAPVLGAARSALRISAERLAVKTEVNGKQARANPAVQTALARAGTEIDSAQLLLERAASTADRGALTDLELSRTPRDFAFAAELLGSAVDRLFRAGGARSQHAHHPVQRAWRDVNCAAGHAVLQFGPAAGVFATHLMENGEHDDA